MSSLKDNLLSNFFLVKKTYYKMCFSKHIKNIPFLTCPPLGIIDGKNETCTGYSEVCKRELNKGQQLVRQQLTLGWPLVF